MADRRYPAGPKVLYIGGTGRTGSTVLLRLLGELPGWIPGGELAFLWRYGIGEGGRCSCGERVLSCPLWAAVLDRVQAGGHLIDPHRMVELRRRCRSVHLPLMLAHSSLAERRMDRLEEFPATVAATYRALAEASGSTVVIDSSKEPHYSWILRDRTDLDVYFLQLVRDPRAVAHSWSRRRSERGFGGDREMGRRGVLRSAAYYDVSNAAAEMIWGRDPARYRFLRYEDLIDRPVETVEAVGSFIGEPIQATPLQGRAFDATPQHIAWGNPNRFDAGRIELRADDAWRRAFATTAAALAWTVTAPLASRYGYPARRIKPRGDVTPARLRDSQLLETP